MHHQLVEYLNNGDSVPIQNLTNTIEFITISSLGGANDFGDIKFSMGNLHHQNDTRGFICWWIHYPTCLINDSIDLLLLHQQEIQVSFGDYYQRRRDVHLQHHQLEEYFGGG